MFLAIASIVSYQSLALANNSGTALTDTQVTHLISGNTIYATNMRGKNYKTYFGANGYLKNSRNEVGKWEVKERLNLQYL